MPNSHSHPESLRIETQPVELFQSRLHGICGSFDVLPTQQRRENVSGHLSVAQFGGLDVAQVGLDVERVSRSTSNIRYDPGNHFFLILQQRGRAQLIQGDAAIWAEPGDMFVVDATKQSTFVYGGEHTLQLSVHLPREEMCHRFGHRIFGGLAIEGDEPMAIAMKAVLTKLMTTDDAAVLPHTVEAFYSVFGALLTERSLGNGGRLNPDRAIVQQALTVIAESYRSPSFNSQSLALLTGVSLRRLQRAFKVTDETPHDRLQRFRVEAAHQHLQLLSMQQDHVSISTVAFEAGFGDLSTFYRVYRRYYGRAPGETLQVE
ncbi:helix-turn-helix domain-containing protein [Gymnodinialimonas ulvae]|uniref:helix-turn-helix domain-containing protein n=1 Tax=Gymnodinialimonas ulvae TaxID=3126504 RepID=UPI003097C920